MTKSRKVGIILAFALVFALIATSIVPLLGVDFNTANAVTVVPHEEWKNAYTGNYYQNLNTSLRGTSFRSQLASLITTTHHTNTVYNGSSSLALNNVWPQSDKDMNNINANTMKWFYTGTVVSANSFGGSSGQTNREHVWAKNAGSTFEPEAGPGADAHHLRPTEVSLNSARSNWGFGEVTQSTSNIVAQAGKTNYGSTVDELCYKGSVNGATLFYPAKGYRGATARILMYMQVRYGDTWNLYFVDGASSSNGKGIGKISDLFKWHLLEPPTTEEIYRNHAIAEIQGNRNPFIDHPEYAEMIYCNNNESYSSKLQGLVNQYGGYLNGGIDPDEIPESLTLSPSSLTLEVGKTSSPITVTASPAGTLNDVSWSSNNTSVATVSSTGVVTAVAKGTATVTATSKYDSTVSAKLTVTVNPVQLTGLTISSSELTLKDGRTAVLTVSPIPSNASAEVTWSSDNTAVATVSSTGHVTAKGEGTAHITATSKEFPSVSVSATVTVVPAPKPVSISVSGTPTKTRYIKGETFDPTGLTVTVMYNDNSTEELTGNALKDCEWLDGVTGETTLSDGTTTVICRYGEFEATVSGITVTNNIEDFLNKMEAVDSNDFDSLTLQQKFEAIKQAVAAYNKLTTAEKNNSQVVAKYSTLRNAIEDYNELANAQNAVLQDAVTLGAGALVRAISTAFAALIVVVKGLLGR